MSKRFKDGQEIWVLEEANIYRPNVKDNIRQCVYKATDYGRDYITYIFNGKLGMSKTITPSELLFETLEELKTYLINQKKSEISELQKKINCINEDIEYVQSLKDIREDRETKINDLLGNDR